MPTVSSAFLIITVVVAQLYLIMYVLMFAAAIKLRYKKPQVERAYKIPGGKLGIWIVSTVGILASVFTFAFGFVPPSTIPFGGVTFYVCFLSLGILLSCLAPWFILRFKKESWNHPLSHDKLENKL